MKNFLVEILIKARDVGASSIDIEPGSNGSAVRFRVDGALHDISTLPLSEHSSLADTVKEHAKLNIHEKKRPQDGIIEFNGPELTERYVVSVFPGLPGDRICISPYGRRTIDFDLDRLGFESEVLNIWKQQLQSNRPSLIVVAGPTNSGKNTTIYSALLEMRKRNLTVATAEYEQRTVLPGVHQVIADVEIGMDFATIGRAFLRNDVDVIFLRDLDDYVTAEIAFKAVLDRNKVVFTAMHCHNAISTVERLINMRIDPWLVTEGVSIIQAQRLLRTLCPNCKEVVQVPHETLVNSGMDITLAKNSVVYRPKGCSQCYNLGYRGMTLVTETFRMTEASARRILQFDERRYLKDCAVEEGMQTLRHNALRKMREGLVSLDDVLLRTPSD